MSGPMVKAILEGRKTQTRRAATPQPVPIAGLYFRHCGHALWAGYMPPGEPADIHEIRCPYGQPGDRLWVRETWAPCGPQSYPAADMVRHGDDGAIHRAAWDRSPPARWRPSIFMPRWASRLTLEVTGVRVERVQEISVADCRAEGVRIPTDDSLLPYEYRALWDKLNAKRGYGWDKNPWVWVVELKPTDAGGP